MTDKYTLLFGGNTFDFTELLSTLDEVKVYLQNYCNYSTSGLPSLLPKYEQPVITLWSSDEENGDYKGDGRIIQREGIPLDNEDMFTITLEAITYRLYEQSPGSKIVGNIKIGPVIIVFGYEYDGDVFTAKIKQPLEKIYSPLLKYATKNELSVVPESLIYKALSEMLTTYTNVYATNAKGAYKALSATGQVFQMHSGAVYLYKPVFQENDDISIVLSNYVRDLFYSMSSCVIHSEHEEGGMFTMILQRDNVVVNKATFVFNNGEWALNDHH